MFIIFKVVELKESLGKEKSAYEHKLGSLQTQVDQEQQDLAETRACLQEAELQHANFKVKHQKLLILKNFCTIYFESDLALFGTLIIYFWGWRAIFGFNCEQFLY